MSVRPAAPPSSSPPAEPAYRHGLRVYWEDTDAGGVVFFANYAKFFERARTEWLRSLGFGQERLRVEQGAMFVVAHTSVRHVAPARLDDWLELTVEVREAGGASFTIAQRCLREGRLLAESEIRIACVDAVSFRPRRIPAGILQEIA